MEKSLPLYILTNGQPSPFPNADEQLVLNSFNVRMQRMGSAPYITATVKYRQCLDGQWDGVFVVFGGERYFVDSEPDTEKNNTDIRYEHTVTFVSERKVLDDVYMVDAVRADATGDEYKSNDTRVVFSGTISQWAARLNAALEYCGLYDAEQETGYHVVVDTGVPMDTALVSFEEKYISEALQEGYKAFGIPYYFAANDDVMEIHLGFHGNDIDTEIKYGVDDALISIGRKNANIRLANRMSGYGSSDCIPYYYPNETPIGNEVSAVVTKASQDSTLEAEIDSLQRVISGLTKFPLSYANKPIRYYGNINCYLDEAERKPYWIEYTGGTVNINYGTDGTEPIIIDNESFVEVAVDGEDWEIDETAVDDPYFILERYIWNNPPFPYFDTINTEYLYDIDNDIAYSLKDGPVVIPAGRYKFIMNAHLTLPGGYIFYDVGRRAYARAKMKLIVDGGTWRDTKGVMIEPSDAGISVSGLPRIGDEISLYADPEGWIEPVRRLMPPIYRETQGEQRFYNALNDTYPLPEGTGYYHFNHPYTEGDKKELIQEFKDIKPTITGTPNASLQRIDQFAAVAFDADDNDDKDSEGNYYHPYFFVKLRKTDGQFGFNIFDCATDSSMQIVMTSGVCGSCKFEIGVDSESRKNTVQVDEDGNLMRNDSGDVICGREGQPKVAIQARQQDTYANEVWIALKKDNKTYPSLMPSVNQNLRPEAGSDTFVIVNINMPQAYILDAEARLKEAIIAQMAIVNSPIFNPSISFSRVFLEDNPSFLESLNENSRLSNIVYNGETYGFYVSQLTYTMSENEIPPEVSVELASEFKAQSNVLDTKLDILKLDILNNLGQSELIRRINNSQSRVGAKGTPVRPVFFDELSEAREIDALDVPGSVVGRSGVAAHGIADLSEGGGSGGGGGTVTGAKIGDGERINPDGNGVLNLPAYPDTTALEGRVTDLEGHIDIMSLPEYDSTVPHTRGESFRVQVSGKWKGYRMTVTQTEAKAWDITECERLNLKTLSRPLHIRKGIIASICN